MMAKARCVPSVQVHPTLTALSLVARGTAARGGRTPGRMARPCSVTTAVPRTICGALAMRQTLLNTSDAENLNMLRKALVVVLTKLSRRRCQLNSLGARILQTLVDNSLNILPTELVRFLQILYMALMVHIQPLADSLPLESLLLHSTLPMRVVSSRPFSRPTDNCSTTFSDFVHLHRRLRRQLEIHSCGRRETIGTR